MVEITARRRQWVEPLLEPSLETHPHDLAVIADEVRGYDRLDISREPPATRGEVEALMGKADVDPGVDQIAELCPVLQVAGAAVDLVNDDALGLALPQFGHHARELPAALFRRGLHFLKPLDDREGIAARVRLNGASLFVE